MNPLTSFSATVPSFIREFAKKVLAEVGSDYLSEPEFLNITKNAGHYWEVNGNELSYLFAANIQKPISKLCLFPAYMWLCMRSPCAACDVQTGFVNALRNNLDYCKQHGILIALNSSFFSLFNTFFEHVEFVRSESSVHVKDANPVASLVFWFLRMGLFVTPIKESLFASYHSTTMASCFWILYLKLQGTNNLKHDYLKHLSDSISVYKYVEISTDDELALNEIVALFNSNQVIHEKLVLAEKYLGNQNNGANLRAVILPMLDEIKKV